MEGINVTGTLSFTYSLVVQVFNFFLPFLNDLAPVQDSNVVLFGCLAVALDDVCFQLSTFTLLNKKKQRNQNEMQARVLMA